MSELKDPRVLFAAERTLLAWNRTCLTLMGFGFLVERFGLFLEIFARDLHTEDGLQRASHLVGMSFLLLGIVLALLSTLQYRRLLQTLGPAEIPRGHWINLAVLANLITAMLGLGVAAYLW